MNDIILFLLGVIFFSFLLEPLIINFIYFTNVGLFLDLFLTKKNRDKLKNFFDEERKVKDYV